MRIRLIKFSLCTLELFHKAFFFLSALGLHALLVPLQGVHEDFSIYFLGLIGAIFAVGFVLGCLFTPHIISFLGGIQTFNVFAVLCAGIAFWMALSVNEITWIVCRLSVGFMFAGCLMVIESLLNQNATNQNRGIIFSIYMAVSSVSSMVGQSIFAVSHFSGLWLFSLSGILFVFSCLGFVSREELSFDSPMRMPLKEVYARSPLAFTGCFLIGLASGAWVSLGPVYGFRIGLSDNRIAWMMFFALASGTLMQIFIGFMLDSVNRRILLSVNSAVSFFISFSIFIFMPRSEIVVLSVVALYGSITYTLYSISVSYAHDKASFKSSLSVSSALLLMYGIGSMIGPILASFLMRWIYPEALFLVTGLSCGFLALYAAFEADKKGILDSMK